MYPDPYTQALELFELGSKLLGKRAYTRGFFLSGSSLGDMKGAARSLDNGSFENCSEQNDPRHLFGGNPNVAAAQP